MVTVTLNLEVAITLIPSLSGGSETELSAFEAKYEFVFSNIAENIKPTILNDIITQLSGKAFFFFLAIRYRTLEDCLELKNHLRTSIFQRKDEKIQEFAGRIEKMYHELTHALTVGKTAAEAAIIAQTVQRQALSIFM